MKSILDRTFKYTPAAQTDIAKTFRRIQAQMKADAQKKPNVTPLKRAAK